jgi:hypothetical protein
MKTKLIGFVLAAATSFAANAQLPDLKLGGGKGGGADPAAIEKFTADANLINKTVFYAVMQIQLALRDKTEIAAQKESVEKMNASTDPQEQNALMGTQMKTELAATTDLMKSKEGKERMEKLSPEMKQKVAKSIFSIGVAALRIQPMIDNGKKAVDGIMANPAMLSKAGLIKDSLQLLAQAAPKLPELVSVGYSMLKDVKVDPGSPTNDSKLVPEKPVVPD